MIRRFFSHPALVFGIVLVLAFAFVAIAAPLLAPPNPRDPYQIPRDGFKRVPLPPNDKHILGTLYQLPNEGPYLNLRRRRGPGESRANRPNH